MKIRSFVAAVAACCLATISHAQDAWPTKPIRVVVPSPAGGANDVLVRTLAERLVPRLGQPLVIDNRTGAGQIIGTEMVAKAEPDGHTLLSTNIVHVINGSVFAKLPYDPLKDFAGVSLAGFTPSVLLAAPALKLGKLDELVQAAKSRPGQITYATAGNGTAGHLVGELFRQASGAQLVHVPYKGIVPAINDAVGGHVGLIYLFGPDAVPHSNSGRLVPLAVAAPKRTPSLPNTPTFAEAGYPAVELSGWYGFLAPAKTPGAVVAKLNRELVAVLSDAAVVERLKGLLFEPQSSSPQEFDALMARDLARFTKVAREAGIKRD